MKDWKTRKNAAAFELDEATKSPTTKRLATPIKLTILSTVKSLKVCAERKDLLQGSRIHHRIRDSGILEKDTYISSTLVGMYAKCGALDNAKQVLDELPVRDIASWNALMTGYVQHGQGQAAIDCFGKILGEGLSPSAITYACILKACGIEQDVHLGIQIHDEIVNQGILKNNVVLSTTLIDMYAKCGLLTKAQIIFDELSERDLISWTALISGYVQQGKGQGALDCFHQMCNEGFSPNAVTYVCILKACGMTQDVRMGGRIHNAVVSQGFLEENIALCNALIDMYAKCGVLMKAQRIFNELPAHDSVTWNALITGYSQQGQNLEVLNIFHQMCRVGTPPNDTMYLCTLKACETLQHIDIVTKIYNEIARHGVMKKNIILGNALIDTYAKCGMLIKAQAVFDELPLRNAASWNALIGGYVYQGRGQEALVSFYQMCREGQSPNPITYNSALKACGITRNLDMGRKIHDEIVSQGLLETNVVLSNALIDMYAKCGVLMKAQRVLDEVSVRNVVSWSALIAGYAQQGQGHEAGCCFHQMRSEGISPNIICWNALIGGYALQGLAKEALDCLQCMQQEGTSPNAITFLNVFNACSHSGLVDEAYKYFDRMREMLDVAPDKDHFACLVDLLGRANLFSKALRLIKLMPLCDDHLPVWSALLGACQQWGNVKVGRYAFEHAIQLDRQGSAPYISMINIYAAAGMQKEAQNIGYTWIRNSV